jgi:hypothetical protein
MKMTALLGWKGTMTASVAMIVKTYELIAEAEIARDCYRSCAGVYR